MKRFINIKRPHDVGKMNGRRATTWRLNAVAAYHSLALPSADKAACAELSRVARMISERRRIHFDKRYSDVPMEQ